MLLVVLLLDPPTALRFIQRRFDGSRHHVRIEDDLTLRIAGGTADGLNQGGFASEQTLLIRVQNGHQGDLGQIDALTEQIDAHQHVKHTGTQIPEQFHSLHGFHVVVDVFHTDAQLVQVFRQILRHFGGQSGDQHPLATGCALTDLARQIVDLGFHRAHLHHGIEKSRGTDQLLHDLGGMLPLIVRRGGGQADHLIQFALEFLKAQGAVIKGRGQTESVLHQILLPCPIAAAHTPHLGQGGVALVNKQKKILGEVIQQGMGRFAGGTPLEDAGVILHAGAVADLTEHFQIVFRPLLDPLCLQQFVLALEIGHPLRQFVLNPLVGRFPHFRRDHVVIGGVHRRISQIPDRRPRQGIDLRHTVDLVAEELHPDRLIRGVGGEDFHRIAPHTELVAGEGHVVPIVLDVHQMGDQFLPGHRHTGAEGGDLRLIFLRRAERIDAGHAGHHDHVTPLEQGTGGAVAKLIDLLIDQSVLFNIHILAGDVGLRLVVIVIGNEVFHRILGEKFPQFRAQLGGQGFVMRQHQGGTVQPGDHVGHGKGLA